MRDQKKSMEYFNAFLNNKQNTINTLIIDMKKSEMQRIPTSDFEYEAMFLLQYEYFIASFSAGKDILMLKMGYKELLYWAQYIEELSYLELLHLLSIAVLLDFNPCESLDKCMNENGDTFLGLFWSYFTQSPVFLDENILYQPYKHLYAELEKTQNKEEQEGVLLNYLKCDWYHGHNDAHWYETLHNPHDVYFGYWCFEAMALAKIYGVDTTRLVQSDYFALL